MWLGAAGAAQAKPRTCSKITGNEISVDGMLDDWSSVRAHQVGRRRSDASFKMRCAHDGRRLFLSFHIRDGHVIRFKNTVPGKNDHLIVKLRVGNSRRSVNLRLFPGVDKIKPRRFWSKRRVPRDVKIEDTMQQRGWSVEIIIPFRRLAGLTKFSPNISADIVYKDFDIGHGKKQVAFRDKLQFPGAASQLRGFLRSTKLRRSQIHTDKLVNVDSKRGPERVVIGGLYVGVISDSFTYMRLPAQSKKDVKSVRVIDLAGKGRHAILAEYRQHGNGGSRDVVAVWYVMNSGKIRRVLAFEVRKAKGGNVLANKWKLTRPGKHRRIRRRRRGYDILVTAGKAKGWDEDNYFIAPSRDVNPILLPWSDDTSSVYTFSGTRANVAKKTR